VRSDWVGMLRFQHYIPNGFRDKKKDQKIFIFKKELFSNGNKPKNYIEELDNYNGLTFLGGFMWD